MVADDPKAEAQRWLALLLVAPPEMIAGLKSGDLLSGWCPVVLPQSGGFFATPDMTRKTAEETWAAVVEELLGIRRSLTLRLDVSDAGEAVLNAVKAYAEEAAARLGQRNGFHRP